MSRPLSPGLAFGCSDLLKATARNVLTPNGAISLSLGSISSKDVLEAAIAIRWLEVTAEGVLALTARGKLALSEQDVRKRLRLLVLDHVDSANPAWLYLSRLGRRDTLLHAPPGIRQILVESGLAHGDDESTVSFWDDLAARARGSRDSSLAKIGRYGERLTLEYEAKRTGGSPKWIALDSSVDGYDVLSTVASGDSRRLTIEVKTSSRPISHSSFYLTRNEWETAQGSRHHAFYLWDISGRCPRLASLSVEEMLPHIPTDSGDGCWETVAVPFDAFAKQFTVAHYHIN